MVGGDNLSLQPFFQGGKHEKSQANHSWGARRKDLLNRIIERIEVFHAVKIDGKKSQGITIVYRFIGAEEDI